MGMHELLMTITADLPCATIQINGEDYLQRYFVRQDADGTQHWLHRFLRNDSERHLHSHPWQATSLIVCGSYVEQGENGNSRFVSGQTNEITPSKLHRIVEVEPNTWTYMTVLPARLPSWHFVDEDGQKTERSSSPRDWWKVRNTRDGRAPFFGGAEWH